MTELLVTMFRNSDDNLQVVTEGDEAKCPSCGYPERHRIFISPFMGSVDGVLVADGCPSCETSRMNEPTEASDGS